MLDLSSPQARTYLAGKLGLHPDDLTLTELGGGVSNIVVLIESAQGRFVAKQALGKLRVEQDWFCTQERIYRECDAIRRFSEVLPAGAVPQVVFEDRENFVFAMTAAPADAVPWKTQLLNGTVHSVVAERVGCYLAWWVAATQKKTGWTRAFDDLSVFSELRLEPYFRSTASRHPDLNQWFLALIKKCSSRGISLVHGDYSPKNLLVSGANVTLIDFEVIHFGDPSFDAGFLNNHLVLKAFHRPEYSYEYRKASGSFWDALRRELPAGFDWLESAAMEQLAGLLLARMDGKSPVEYIQDPARKDTIRQVARGLITRPARQMEEVWERVLG